ncbi:valine--tRNA ligase [Conglomerata obtusa]
MNDRKQLKAEKKLKKLEKLHNKQTRVPTTSNKERSTYKPVTIISNTVPGELKDLSVMPDSYDPAYVEEGWFAFWEKNGLFKPEATFQINKNDDDCNSSCIAMDAIKNNDFDDRCKFSNLNNTNNFKKEQKNKVLDKTHKQDVNTSFKENQFEKDEGQINKSCQKFVIPIPPPNVTGSLHIGHAMMVAIQDTTIRYNRMLGKEVLYVPGTDHAGIATQAVVEKKIYKETMRLKEDLGREKFVDEIFAWKKNYGNKIYEQMKRMGSSLDFSREVFTLDEKYCDAVVEAFNIFHEKGLIYRDSKLVNWSGKMKTSLSDLEVNHEEIKGGSLVNVDGKEYKFGVLFYFKYPILKIKTENNMLENSNNTVKFYKEVTNGKYFYNGDFIEFLDVSTTRPETIFGDTAICLNAKDERYLLDDYVAVNPLTRIIIPIIYDDYCDTNFGTGILKITPAHDFNDFEIGKRHNLEEISIIDEQNNIDLGKIKMKNLYNEKNHFNSYENLNYENNLEQNKKCFYKDNHISNDLISDKQKNLIDKLHGINRFEARIQINEFLKANNLFIKEELHNQTLPFCSRSNDIIEPMIKKQWWMKCSNMGAKASEAVRNGTLEIHPPECKKTWYNWLDNIRDWCLSRQLWWGHRIPAWRVNCKNKNVGWIVGRNYLDLIKKLKEIEKVKSEKAIIKKCVKNYSNKDCNTKGNKSINRHNDDEESKNIGNNECEKNCNNINGNKEESKNNNDGYNDDSKNTCNNNIKNNDAINKNNEENEISINSKVLPEFIIFLNDQIYIFQQDEDVLDTWFSSGLWPFAIFGWPNKTIDLQKYYPNTLLETGYDILFFWVARMVMMSMELNNIIPFNKILLHGIVRDAHGKKMSKSLGNVIDPLFVIEGITLSELHTKIENVSDKEKERAIQAQKKDYPRGIPSCGADALRFALCSYSNGVKDINLDVLRVEGYRRLCNKIWNAFKFVKYINNIGTSSNIDKNNQSSIEKEITEKETLEKESIGGEMLKNKILKKEIPKNEIPKKELLEKELSENTSVEKNNIASSNMTSNIEFYASNTCNKSRHNNQNNSNTFSTNKNTLFMNWIYVKRNETIKNLKNSIESYNFMNATQAIYKFFMNDFCDVFIEIVKRNENNEEDKRELLHIFIDILKMFHPFMPFITEEIFYRLKDYDPEIKDIKSISISPFPKEKFNISCGKLSDIMCNKKVATTNFDKETNLKIISNQSSDFKKIEESNIDSFVTTTLSSVNKKEFENDIVNNIHFHSINKCINNEQEIYIDNINLHQLNKYNSNNKEGKEYQRIDTGMNNIENLSRLSLENSIDDIQNISQGNDMLSGYDYILECAKKFDAVLLAVKSIRSIIDSASIKKCNIEIMNSNEEINYYIKILIKGVENVLMVDKIKCELIDEAGEFRFGINNLEEKKEEVYLSDE